MGLNIPQRKRVFMLVDIDPVAKPRMTRADKWKKRPCVMRYRQFADDLREAIAKANFVVGNQLYMEFHIPMPKSWSKKKKAELIGSPHFQSTPDTDNLCKACLDALIDQDCRVWHLEAKKYWSEKGRIKIENK